LKKNIQKNTKQKIKRIIIVTLLVIVCFLSLSLSGDIQKIVNPITDSINKVITPTPIEVLPVSAAIIRETLQTSKLETADTPIEERYDGTKDLDYLWGLFSQKMIFMAYGNIISGVDLSKIQESDITPINTDTVKIRLPKSEILHVILNNNLSGVMDVKLGIMADLDDQMETRIRQYAQNDFEKTAQSSSNILSKATENAQDSIKKLLEPLNYKYFIFY